MTAAVTRASREGHGSGLACGAGSSACGRLLLLPSYSQIASVAEKPATGGLTSTSMPCNDRPSRARWAEWRRIGALVWTIISNY